MPRQKKHALTTLLSRCRRAAAGNGFASGNNDSTPNDAQGCAVSHVCRGPCPKCGVCPLSSLEVGQAGCLQNACVGRRLRRRLAELGLTPGVEMTVLQNTGGPVLVCVRNSRLALGRQTAQRLEVLPVGLEEA